MWVEGSRFGQRPSFVAPVTPPDEAPDQGLQVCLHVNVLHLPIVLGCMMQGMLPGTWDVPSRAALLAVLAEWTDLIASWAAAEACEMVRIRFDEPTCTLQQSLDGGVTWTDGPGWNPGFRHCVLNIVGPHIGPILMMDGVSHPPVPMHNDAGTDWLYYG